MSIAFLKIQKEMEILRQSSYARLVLFLECVLLIHVVACLRPQTSETREIQLLDGLWNFRHCNRTHPVEGFAEQWYRRSLMRVTRTIPMPVPSSFNDITQDKALRDHVGWVWYDREFFVAKDWQKRRVVLRFESVHYYAQVWLNGEDVMNHTGGHLPFESDVTGLLNFSGSNRVTVAVNNTLTPFTLPCGHIVYPQDTNNYPPGYFRQELIFDFFNYAGIHRSVILYTTDVEAYVSVVRITTIDDADRRAVVNYNITYNGSLPAGDPALCQIEISDADGTVAAVKATDCFGKIVIDEAKLWWPVGMRERAGHLYEMKISLTVDGIIRDVYRQKFGIRTVKVTPQGVTINGRPFYFLGFGKHEDFHIFGRAFNLPLMVKDFNLIDWTGGNSFRTSHYPYAEEVLDYADTQGIVVIDEGPAVGLHQFPDKTLKHHLQVMEELIDRDCNHPSVIMWSVANEPKSQDSAAKEYFRTVIEHTRKLDPSRPVTFVIGGSNASLDQAAELVDVLCVNHYYGWYSDPGHTELIGRQLLYDIRKWRERFQKPVIITEYGADTMAGIHTSPSSIFSEEYQVDFMAAYHMAFDQLRAEGILTGEMIWNFADFMTDQQVNRVWGNRKGIFTRERQPKIAAHFLRRRYRHLTQFSSDNESTDNSGFRNKYNLFDYFPLEDVVAIQL